MTTNTVTENKMGVLPINRLLISMSLPIMISMLVQALYNIVDSIFVSQINENAFTAVSLAFPVQNLMIAMGAGTGVGINALLSKSLGEKNFGLANKAARNGIFLTFINFIVFILFGLFFTRTFFSAQSTNPEIVDYGVDYLSIIATMSIGLFGQITMERLLQATGKTIFSMFTQTLGAVVNIILDPVFIFGLGPVPKMDVKGAALATIIGQLLAMLLGIYLNVTKNKEININMLGFRPDWRVIKKIYAVGIPSIIMQSITSIMTFCMNKILGSYSDTAQAVLGAYFKLQSFIFMPVFGLTNGLIPILSYNYGARKRKRMTSTIRYGAIYAITIMILGITLMQLIPDVMLKMFDASDNMLSMGSTAMRIISLSFIFAGFGIITSASLQALGHGVFSMLISITRQLVVLLPAGFIIANLTHYSNVDYIWWAFPISEIASFVCSILFLKHIYKKVISVIA
ncbi:MAG: MATE family efflux transporter [Ruminococcus sp.]|nr:MATE family efflux transporter [Ruminococcus sp.]